MTPGLQLGRSLGPSTVGRWRSHDNGSDSPTMLEVMADAARLESWQPEAALGRFRSLAGEAGFPYRHFAREQCAVILWRLGRRDEALRTLRIHRQLVYEESGPEPAYARARRSILRLAEAMSSGRAEGSDEQLGEAERICERNGDLIMVAKVNRLKARLCSCDRQPAA
jgi:hypothetical protein